jgi:hypothetical protein
MSHQITIEEAIAEQESKRVFCRRCGRELKSKQAKELGFGITCYRKHMKECLCSNRKRLFKVEEK